MIDQLGFEMIFGYLVPYAETSTVDPRRIPLRAWVHELRGCQLTAKDMQYVKDMIAARHDLWMSEPKIAKKFTPIPRKKKIVEKMKGIILTKGSRTEFPAGGRCAVGKEVWSFKSPKVRSDVTIQTTMMELAFKKALHCFCQEFGRLPDISNLLFRGSFNVKECIVEICEITND